MRSMLSCVVLLPLVQLSVAAEPVAPPAFPFPVLGQPTVISARWDFESGMREGWNGTGLRVWSGSENRRVAEVVFSGAHQGTACLQVRDEKADCNTGTSLEIIDIDPRVAYTFTCALRAAQARPAGPVLRVATIAAGGGPLRWLPVPPVALTATWTPISVTLSDLPADTGRLIIDIRLCNGLPNEATGEMWVDDLAVFPQGSQPPPYRNVIAGGPLPAPPPVAASEQTAPEPLLAQAPWKPGLALAAGFTALDLAAVANRGFADEVAGDGKGGWTDQGDNDLRGMPTGLVEVGGVPFAIVDPAANRGAGALILRHGGSPAFAEEARLEVGRSADRICLLHASAWTQRDAVVGRIEVIHGDGSRSELPVVVGEHLADWWGGESRRSHARPLPGVNPRRDPVFLHAASFANPKPGQPIQAIVLHAPATVGNVTWMVLGATLSTGADPVVPTLWADGRILPPAEVARLGLVAPESLAADPVPLRLEPGPAISLVVNAGETLRQTPRAVAGVSFHRVVGYGLAAFPAPYHTSFPYPLSVSAEHQQRIRDLHVPMTRFYGVGDEPFPVEESIDRIAALLDRVGIQQEGCVLELEEQGANEALSPATWARAVRHVRERGYRFRRWEIGNEVYTGGLWKAGGKAFPTPETYIAHAREVAAAVRAEQPEALIGVSFFDGSVRWGNQVLKALAGSYDFAVAHWYQFPNHIRDFEATVIDENHWTLDRIQLINALLRTYNPGRRVHQFDTEWGLHARGDKDYGGGGIPPGGEVGAYRPNANIIGVVQRAVRLIYYLREGQLEGSGLWCMFGRSQMPALTLLPVEPEARGKTTMVYELYRNLARVIDDRVVGISGQAPFRTMGKALRGRTGIQVPLTPAVAMASAAGDRVTLMIANGSWTAAFPARVALRGFTARRVEGVVISHDGTDADPVISRPEEVVSALPVAIEAGELRFTLPPHAVAFIEVR